MCKADREGGADEPAGDCRTGAVGGPADAVESLLAAANGINRPDRENTAPSAMNNQEIEIYYVP